MNDQLFSLHPFPAGRSPMPFQITGSITRAANRLTIHYELRGDRSNLLIATPSDLPIRKHELWQDTCFEFFLGIPQSDRYWEFNLSPAGHWNIYRFDSYRQGMQEELAWLTLPFRVQNQPDTISLTLDLALDAIAPANQSLEVSITTVIKHLNGEVTYWALTHPGPEADFHRRDSFLLTV